MDGVPPLHYSLHYIITSPLPAGNEHGLGRIVHRLNFDSHPSPVAQSLQPFKTAWLLALSEKCFHLETISLYDVRRNGEEPRVPGENPQRPKLRTGERLPW